MFLSSFSSDLWKPWEIYGLVDFEPKRKNAVQVAVSSSAGSHLDSLLLAKFL